MRFVVVYGIRFGYRVFGSRVFRILVFYIVFFSFFFTVIGLIFFWIFLRGRVFVRFWEVCFIGGGEEEGRIVNVWICIFC